MKKKKSKNKKSATRDVNQLAHSFVERISTDSEDGKNPAAVALGRLGGLKGGPARKAALSPERRKEIARRAIAARWKNKK